MRQIPLDLPKGIVDLGGKRPRPEEVPVSHVIPKRKVPVRLQLDSGEAVEGRVYLDYIDVIHRGEQTLLDKFNDDYEWFPLAGEDGVQILNRRRVLTVEPGDGLPPELVRKENSPVFRREEVTLVLPGGLRLAGQIAMDLPDEFSRVSDFLNFPQSFFALERSEGPVLVAKDHLVGIVPHERPPVLPAGSDASAAESD
jgi:hypothetical protein